MNIYSVGLVLGADGGFDQECGQKVDFPRPQKYFKFFVFHFMIIFHTLFMKSYYKRKNS